MLMNRPTSSAERGPSDNRVIRHHSRLTAIRQTAADEACSKAPASALRCRVRRPRTGSRPCRTRSHCAARRGCDAAGRGDDRGCAQSRAAGGRHRSAFDQPNPKTGHCCRDTIGRREFGSSLRSVSGRGQKSLNPQFGAFIAGRYARDRRRHPARPRALDQRSYT